MRFIKRIASVIKGSYKAACKTEKENRFRLGIFLDILYCKVRFHASAEEYLRYRFYDFRDRYRKNFLLLYHQRHEYKKINETGFTGSKYLFYQRIPDCFFREMILAPSCGEARFVAFAREHRRIVTKPDGGSYGKGIEAYTYTDDDHAREYFTTLPKNTVCEAFICQHEGVGLLNPNSVNTVRIVSLIYGGEVTIVSATLKTGGRTDTFADNMHNDGIGAQVDIATGVVNTCGFDYNSGRYLKHPVSNVQFLGLQIPNWNAAVDLVKKAHGQLPQCKLLGWDVAITPTGADIVEANNAPGTLLMQIGDMVPKGEKILQVIREAGKKRH